MSMGSRSLEDKAMPMPMSSQIKAGREGVGLFENALSMLTSAAGEPAAGMVALAELIRGGDSGAARDAVRQAFSYQPRTDAGQRQQRMLGELAASAMNSAPVRTWQRGVDIAGRYSPAAGAALQTVPTAIGVVTGAKPAMQQGRALSELAQMTQNRMVQNAMTPGGINTGPIGRQRGAIDLSAIQKGAQVIDKWGDDGIYLGPDPSNQDKAIIQQGRASYSINIADLNEGNAKISTKPNGTVRLYHGSYEKNPFVIGEGSRDRFGGIFTSYGGVEPAYSGHKYYVDIPEEKILTRQTQNYHVPYDKQVKAVEKVSGVKRTDPDFEDVFNVITEDSSADMESYLAAMQKRGFFDYGSTDAENISEASWDAQKLRGRFAKELGFDAVEMIDDTGTSVLVVKKTKVSPIK